ncbi:MAG: O-antigen ligase family protein [Planctomycetota bacterium]
MNTLTRHFDRLLQRGVSVLVLVAAVACSVLATPVLVPFDEEGLRLAICLCVLGPLVWLAYQGSPAAVPYLLAVIVLNRGLRRVLDWSAGEFSAVTVLSILPALAASVLGVAALARWASIPKPVRVTGWIVLALLGYGAVRGVGNGIGFAVALSDYTSILALVFYVSSIRATPRDIDGWYRAMAWLAAGAVAYGWYQFLVLPPWDAAWMGWSQMNSIGAIEAGGFRPFSTMASPGPYSVFLALALVPALVNARWRPGGWLVPAFILSGLLLTLVRSAWLMLAVGLVVWAMTGRSREAGRTVMVVGVMAIAGGFVMPYVPGADRISNRLDSLTHLGSDHSASDRADLLRDGPQMLVHHPLGQGLGSTGTAVRMANADRSNVALDNGVFFYFLTFGALGGAAFVVVAVRLWRGLSGGRWLPSADASPAERMAFVGFVMLLFGLSAVNVIANASAWAVWAFVAVTLGRRTRAAQRRVAADDDGAIEDGIELASGVGVPGHESSLGRGRPAGGWA